MEEKFLEDLKKFSILCVEDEEGIRKRLINILKYYFDDIYEASNGNDAIKLFKDINPDIVFTDIQMNNGNGIELVKEIRQVNRDVKIVVLTAHSTEEYLYELINQEINHYIIKPFNASKLKDVLEKVLRDKIGSKIELAKGLFLDSTTREIKYENDSIQLRKRERDFLFLLNENKNKCITSYFQIEEVIWENSYMSTSALKTFIRDLRKKLPLDIIINIPQEGYTLKEF